MKKILSLIIMAGLSIVPAFAQDSSSDKAASEPPVQQSQPLPIEHPSVDKNWEVIFKDDFNTFNDTRWYKTFGPRNAGKGNDEGVEFRTHDNAFIDNGQLVLRTQKQNHLCTSTNCRYADNIHKYTSGSIGSNARYKYGYYEIRAKLPACNGFAPSFWFWYSEPNPPCWYNEINVFEVNVCKSDSYESNFRWDFTCPDPENINGESVAVACNYGDDYHWYGLEWDSLKITWYLDRKIVRQRINNMGGTGIQNAMKFLLTVELCEDGEECCPIPSNTQFPKDMLVDQANAYRLKFDCDSVVHEIPDFDTFNYAVKKSITLSGTSSIAPGEKIVLRATDFIELKAGFEVPLGAELYLGANPCSETVIE